MALTLNSYPGVIDKAAAFNITTSLVEDSTHVNLRIRADVYHEGVVKASVEKPKGIADFDFSAILKSLVPGIKFARYSSDLVKTGTIGSQLITSWSASAGSTWDTLTSAGAQITAAVEASTDPTFAETNNVAMTIGELYLLYSPDFVTSGALRPYFAIDTGDHELTDCYVNKGVLIMPVSTGNKKIKIGHVQGQMNFSGTFYLYKITTDRTTYGGLLAPYFVKFTEVYENSSGVTTTGATTNTMVYRYVPAVGDGTAFTEYVLHDNTCLFACKTLRSAVATKYIINLYHEYHVVFFTEYVQLEYFWQRDGSGGYDHATHPDCYEGWGVLVLNLQASNPMIHTVSYLDLYLKERVGATTISETYRVYAENGYIDEREILEFNGLVGGREYLDFTGITDKKYNTDRKYYKNSSKVRSFIEASAVNRQLLETVFSDMTKTEYLKSLMVANTVKKLVSNDTAVDVTVTTDDITVDKGRDLFTNQIEIEY